MSTYNRIQVTATSWVIVEAGRDFRRPKKATTFAFDTEAQAYYDGKLVATEALYETIKDMTNDEVRQHVTNHVWSWQCYDELNGFMMTNDFNLWLFYQCRAGYKFGWCYNSTYDFSQIDYELLAKGRDKWRPHVHSKRGKGDPYTYESLHNNMGARYAYKLWVPYRTVTRHTYVHAVAYHDLLKLTTGSLKSVLEDLDIRDNEGLPIRKLTMEYQQVDTSLTGLTDNDIAYCCNDVKGLYYAVKSLNKTIEEQSQGECHIFGKYTNIMTAGGLAKRLMLQSIYPLTKLKYRIKRFQKEHPMTAEQDKYFRDNHLYRGGISLVNKWLQGKLVMRTMYRYDVNSEYPYVMSNIRTLIGKPFRVSYQQYIHDHDRYKEDYEAIYILSSVYGELRPHMLGVWYNVFAKEYQDSIYEYGTHLIYEFELEELSNWYDLQYSCSEVILVKRGDTIYKDFIEKYYELKATAKAEGNKLKTKIAKITLNSSYGKLAERVERIQTHYELNEATGAIHNVVDGVEIQDSSMLSVLDGALVTAKARTYILQHIRKISKNNPRDNFIYVDTDSVHSFLEYEEADAINLGGFKCEMVCSACKYLAPKTYIDIGNINPDSTVNLSEFEIHCKGLNVKAVYDDIMASGRLPTLKELAGKVEYGQQYQCLQAINVRGGKVLLPMRKYIAREELRPLNSDSKVVYTNYNEKAVLMEV